nr:paralemmin-3-like isoform X2 [Scatophagus argus]
MEGAPLSPTSLDTQTPRSPLWGSQAQEIEKHIDKLQSESQRLAEEEEKLKEQMENGQMEPSKVEEGGTELAHDAVVQNGGNKATTLETAGNEMKTNQSPSVNETAAVITNGGEDLEADTSPDASEHDNQSTTNGPVVASEGVISMKLESELSLGVSEAEPSHVPSVSINEEEEEGTLVMRAERVIITDEGDDVPEHLMPQEDQQKTMKSKEIPLPDPEAGQQGRECAEEVVKTEAAPEPCEVSEPTEEAQPATADGDMQGGVKTIENRDGETKAEGQDICSEESTFGQVQPPANAPEGTTLSLVPVYSQSALNPALEAEGEAAVSPEGAEVPLKAQDPGQFQEVPLADPQENLKTATGPGEQEPLLSQAKAPDTGAGPATANSPTNTGTHSPTRANQGEETEAPKRKTCQCCSVM